MRVLVNYHIIVSWQGHTDFCLIHLSYPFVSLAVRGSNKLSYTHFQPFPMNTASRDIFHRGGRFWIILSNYVAPVAKGFILLGALPLVKQSSFPEYDDYV